MIINRGATATLVAEWREYEGGPHVAVTDVQITITPLAGGAAAVGPTSTGVLTPAVGINTYAWTVPSGQALGDYLVAWTGTDPDSETVTASEIVTVSSALTAPLGGPYATLAMLKSRMGIPDAQTARDTELTQRLRSASQDINSWTHRQFGRAEDVSTRTFPVGRTGVDTHDFWTTDGLVITPYLGTTAGTDWDVATLALEPTDGIVNQVPGWPYRRVAMSGSGVHPIWAAATWRGYTVQVTAKWGWENVPEPVVTSCLMLAVMDDKAKDAPFGVAGFGDFGIRIRANPMVEQKLRDYVLDENLLVGS
jgi:hypothetical protein